MDKKILLSGAAALIMGAGLFATPATAALDLSLSGKASVTASMSDVCTVTTDRALTDNALITANLIAAANGLSNGDVEDGDSILSTDIKTSAGCASNVNEDHPKWALAEEMTYSASATLANGLGVSVSGDIAPTSPTIGLSGAFGSLTFKDGIDSAVKAAAVNGEGDVSVTGNDVGAHKWGTAGTAGVGILWQAPSMSGMDLYVGYSPNSASSGLDSAEHKDTIGFGASFAAGDISISAGFESTTGAACDTLVDGSDLNHPARATSGTSVNPSTLAAVADQALGGEACGDESNTALGAKFTAAGLNMNVGWSQLDSDGADTTVMNLGVSTDLGEYTLSLDYVDLAKTYGYLSTVSDDQTKIGVGLSTSLGDGVTLTGKFSTNDYNVAGTGSDTNYLASLKLEATY